MNYSSRGKRKRRPPDYMAGLLHARAGDSSPHEGPRSPSSGQWRTMQRPSYSPGASGPIGVGPGPGSAASPDVE